ncbi:hypothetical protein DSO57_1019389 [Entomophthora muscae]|uniref:Uncharacterized protein n=1 Tax=Entomophthora muscae TaxID=34485 RepID=A0ACC2TEZ9_9FUNG|nr:hypothetical protein DSO57_1019389 [Entomophthora muscae]
MLWAHKSQCSKLGDGKVVLPFTIIKILVEKLLFALEFLDEGLPKMKEAAVYFSIEGGLKGSELSLLNTVMWFPLSPKMVFCSW